MKNVNIITKRSKRDIAGELRKNGFVNIHGVLEVMAHKNGKMFHYETGDNVVTIWAKHATMHMLTGESFSTHGKQRIFDDGFYGGDDTAHTATAIGEGRNLDGTLLSGEQYFSTNTDPTFSPEAKWSKATVNPETGLGDASGTDGSMIHPFFPTKMLFGTGFEYTSWNDIIQQHGDESVDPNSGYTGIARQGFYENEGWDESIFEDGISDTDNDYSARGDGSSLLKTRSMNDIFSGSITTPTIQDDDIGVPGAIKDGLYDDSAVYRGDTGSAPESEQKTETSEGDNEFLKRKWRGIGRPCFIYSTREQRFFQEGSEVALSYDTPQGENKITYQVIMPEQTGDNAGIFYPYNGYTLKVAGLFADARFLLNNTDPTSVASDPEELRLFQQMPYGLMYAKRYISPIRKSHDVSITSRWTLYL